MNTRYIKWLEISALIVLIVFILVVISFQALNLNLKPDFSAGVTYSNAYAQDLGLDADETLIAILDDLQVRHFRIPAYWSLLQPTHSQWDWAWLDRELDAIAARKGTVTLAVGYKLPRWPECWIPDWAHNFTAVEQEQAVLAYLDQVINRYQTHPAIIGWQVENEANFPFGICPKMSNNFIKKEISFIKSKNTNKPITTTDSGELSLWRVGGAVDQLGVSVYRVVIGPLGIMRYWFIPPQFYLRKGQVIQAFTKSAPIYISEFQMEPWVKSTIPQVPINEQLATFDIRQMQDNINYAKKMGVNRIDFWGVEWWYWMKKVNNDSSYWNLAKTIFKSEP